MNFINYSQKAKNSSNMLRKSMTDAEIKLWHHIRKKRINNLQFYRQKPLGKYIVDFYCADKKLILEIDGSQHYESKAKLYDKKRTDFLQNKLGMKVIRFSNLEVLINIDSVLERIYQLTC